MSSANPEEEILCDPPNMFTFPQSEQATEGAPGGNMSIVAHPEHLCVSKTDVRYTSGGGYKNSSTPKRMVVTKVRFAHLLITSLDS